MIRGTAVAMALLAVVVLTGCSVGVTKSPQPFPGFQIDSSSDTATLRESRHVFVAAVDGKIYDRKGVTFGGFWDTYRQFQVPPGTRQVTIFYDAAPEPSFVNFNTGNPGITVTLNVDLKAGRTYSFTPDVNRLHLSLGLYVMYDFWQPAILDEETKQAVVFASGRTRVNQ